MDARRRRGSLLILLAAFASFSLSVTLWFTDNRDEGIFVDGNPLQGREAAHTVRVREGERIVADGPFAETKEIVGGYYVVDCSTLDQAIDAAARIPSARFGAVEVRPVAQM